MAEIQSKEMQMLEKSGLADEKIAACLRDSYAIEAARVDFLPLGNDASSWVYRVTGADGSAYFLKVKQGEIYLPAVLVPHALRQRGIRPVVAPLETCGGGLWVSCGPFHLILYPFIEGRTGMDSGMSEGQWTHFGAVLKQIHATQLAPQVLRRVQRENFVPAWAEPVRQVQQLVARGYFRDALEAECAAFWQGRRAEIEQITACTEALGRMQQSRAQDFVLCHCDIHTANILLDAQGELHIVDWDQPQLAPVERDLMFVAGATEAEWFFNGYGETRIDPIGLAYYHYEWVVQELGDYGSRVFLTPVSGDAVRRDAVRGLAQLFEPGDVVDAAYRSNS
jgi:spectinomycin phosphotransferase